MGGSVHEDDVPVDVCIMPRWAGTAADDWYAFVRAELVDHSVHVASLQPTANAPTIEDCVASLHELYAGLDLSQTLLVGHSVGCLAQLHALASLSANAQAPTLLCVAGWWWVEEPWHTIRPWMDTPVDVAKVLRHMARVQVLLSDNDPFTSDYAKNGAAWHERLGAEVTIVPGAKHFNRAREPEVLDAVRRCLA